MMPNSTAGPTITSLFLVSTLISGCGGAHLSRPIEIDELIIRNETSGPLYDIKLKVEKTGAVVTCNYIGAGLDFSTEFPLRRYQGNSIRLAWQQNGQALSTADLYAEVPDSLVLNVATAVVVTIHSNGMSGVRLEQ